MLPMRISVSLVAVFCCAVAGADASSAAARNDTESRFLIGIFLDCQSEHATAMRLPTHWRLLQGKFRKSGGRCRLTLCHNLWQNALPRALLMRDRHASTQTAGLRDLEPARRPASRSGHRRARRPDLPDHVLRVSGRRPRRGAVQPRARRPHLHPHLQPDDGGARGAAGGAGKRRRRDLHRKRHGGDASRHRDADECRAATSSPSASLYGGTINLLAHTLPRFGITTTFVKPRDLDGFSAAIRPNTRLIIAETIGNPGLEVLDIPQSGGDRACGAKSRC